MSQTLRKSNKVYALSDEKKNPAQSRWKIILHRGSFRRADQKSQWLGSSKVRLRLFLNLRKKKRIGFNGFDFMTFTVLWATLNILITIHAKVYWVFGPRSYREFYLKKMSRMCFQNFSAIDRKFFSIGFMRHSFKIKGFRGWRIFTDSFSSFSRIMPSFFDTLLQFFGISWALIVLRAKALPKYCYTLTEGL